MQLNSHKIRFTALFVLVKYLFSLFIFDRIYFVEYYWRYEIHLLRL